MNISSILNYRRQEVVMEHDGKEIASLAGLELSECSNRKSALDRIG